LTVCGPPGTQFKRIGTNWDKGDACEKIVRSL
jgi:hypothetical protein